MQTAVAYDFKGGLLAAERQLAVDVTATLDWSALGELEDVTDLENAAAPMLETEVFRTESTFDALGRARTQTTPDGTVVRLAYNEAALLESVSANVRGSASETAFVSNVDYDVQGRRSLIAYGNGTETTYAYDDVTQRLTRMRTQRADDSGRICDVETRTVEGGSAVATPTTHHRYQYSNHLGSASLELTGSAEVISYEEYHPYGTSSYRAVNSSIDVSERTYRYTGKERDEETGLGYHGARCYACWLGRWTASDPIGLGDGVNRYAYVSGNPVGFVDPGGQRKTPAEMAALRQEVAQIRKDAISQAQSDLLENGRELAQRQLRYDSLVDSGEATPLQLSNAQRDLAEYRTRSLASIDRLAYAYEHGALPDWQVARLKIADLKFAEIEILQGNAPHGFDEDAFERDNLRDLALEVGEGGVDNFTPVGTLKDVDAAAEDRDLILVGAIVLSERVPVPKSVRRRFRRMFSKGLRRFRSKTAKAGAEVAGELGGDGETVRRFLSKKDAKAARKKGIPFDSSARKPGIDAASTDIEPVDPDRISDALGARNADAFVDIDISGKSILRRRTKAGNKEIVILEDVRPDDIVDHGRVKKSRMSKWLPMDHVRRVISSVLDDVVSLDALFAKTESPSADEMSPEERSTLSDLLERLIIRRIEVVNAFGWLIRLDRQRAVSIVLRRYLGRSVSPDSKFGGYESEISMILEELVEVGGRHSLVVLATHSDFDPLKLTDPRVARSISDIVQVEPEAVLAWHRGLTVGEPQDD